MGRERLTQQDIERTEAARRKVAEVTIHWASYSNDDLADDEEPNPSPDEGWYVNVDIDGASYTVGPDHFGPGFPTLDAALTQVRKWADGRGLKIDTELFMLPVWNKS